MLFRNIVLTAIFSAVISGLLLGAMQSFVTTPIIYSAEEYEVVEDTTATETAGHSHSDGAGAHSHSHSHGADEWQPANNEQRTAYTFLTAVLIAFGHSLLLTSFMALVFLKFSKPSISWKSGLIIGLGGYLSFYLATVVGLPPEIPGVITADLAERQMWWILTVTATVIGLSTLYFAAIPFKAIGLVVIALPHIIGAPHPEVSGFFTQDAVAITALSNLEQQFLVSTAWVNLVYWLVLGVVSGYFAKKTLPLGGRDFSMRNASYP